MDDYESGFTLVEVLITLSIVALLGAVAVPSYQDYYARNARYVAQSSLQQLALYMERHYLANYSYLGAAEGGADTGIVPGFELKPDSRYRYEINQSQQQTYWLAARPISAQLGDQCGSLYLNELGLKGSADDTGECWNGNSNHRP